MFCGCRGLNQDFSYWRIFEADEVDMFKDCPKIARNQHWCYVFRGTRKYVLILALACYAFVPLYYGFAHR